MKTLKHIIIYRDNSVCVDGEYRHWDKEEFELYRIPLLRLAPNAGDYDIPESYYKSVSPREYIHFKVWYNHYVGNKAIKIIPGQEKAEIVITDKMIYDLYKKKKPGELNNLYPEIRRAVFGFRKLEKAKTVKKWKAWQLRYHANMLIKSGYAMHHMVNKKFKKTYKKPIAGRKKISDSKIAA